MKILGLVTLYFPPVEIAENIASYLDGLDALFVWDNTPEGNLIALSPDQEVKVSYVRRGENVGIGIALNEAARYAMDNGFTHLLTMDQDSSFLPGEFERYLNIIKRCGDERFFQFSPSRAKRSSSPNNELKDSRKYIEIEEIADTIVSGTVTPVSVLKQIGLFYEQFVMDAIDTEYGLRIHRAGGKIGGVPSVYLKHQLGYPIRKRFWGWTLESFNYSPMRTYYIARNFLFLKHLYPEYDCKYILKRLILRRFLCILCIEQNKWEKARALLFGAFQGLTRQMNRDLFYKKMRQ